MEENQTKQSPNGNAARNYQKGNQNRNAQGGEGSIFLGDESGNTQQVVSHLMDMNQRLMLHSERLGLLLELFSRNYVELIEEKRSMIGKKF